MTTYHRIEIVDDDARIICDAPEGSACRVWCDEGCEYDTETHRTEHELMDTGECIILGWLAEDPLDAYVGHEAPTRSGPIRPIWEGDYYSWEYADEGCKG